MWNLPTPYSRPTIRPPARIIAAAGESNDARPRYILKKNKIKATTLIYSRMRISADMVGSSNELRRTQIYYYYPYPPQRKYEWWKKNQFNISYQPFCIYFWMRINSLFTFSLFSAWMFVYINMLHTFVRVCGVDSYCVIIIICGVISCVRECCLRCHVWVRVRA